MTTFQSTLQSQYGTASRDQTMQANTEAASQLESEATQDALWRMAQNNAIAKLRGFNTLAKSVNDMA